MTTVVKLAPDRGTTPPADVRVTTRPHVVDGLGDYTGIARGVGSTLGYDLSDITMSVGPLRRSIDGASTVEITVSDPEDYLIETPMIGSDWTLSLGEQTFQTVKKRRMDWNAWQITLESELVVALKLDKAYRHAERGKVTRAQFARQVAAPAIARVGGKFFSPELNRVQREQRTERQRARQRGLHPKTTLTIKGAPASAAQLREVQTALDVAVDLKASGKVCLALLVAGIGESDFKPVINSLGYGGVFQGQVNTGGRYFKVHETAKMARYFLQGGKGFQQGGAIALAKRNPSLTPGDIATRVEASGKPGSFYQDHIEEARALLDAYGGKADEADEREYTFRQGEPGKPARAWDALEQLAAPVRWRRFEVGNVLFFMSEDDLIKSAPRGVIRMRRSQPGLRGNPYVDLDDGKPADEISVDWACGLWDCPPGTVIRVEGSGKMNGRWLVSEIERRSLYEATCLVTLKRPEWARPEPAGGPRARSGGRQAGSLDQISLTSAWGGTQSIFEQFIHPFMARRGLNAGSQKRDRQSTASGGTSDHWVGAKKSWATDYPTMSGEDDARALARALGWSSWQPNSYASKVVTIAGKRFRVQILWGAGVNHGDHVHVGLKRV